MDVEVIHKIINAINWHRKYRRSHFQHEHLAAEFSCYRWPLGDRSLRSVTIWGLDCAVFYVTANTV